MKSLAAAVLATAVGISGTDLMADVSAFDPNDCGALQMGRVLATEIRKVLGM